MYSSLILLAHEVERHVGRTALPLVGDRHPERAAHLRTVDRTFTSEPTTAAQALEDSYRALTTATVTRKRTKKGTSTKVTRHGRSLVVGDAWPADIEQYGSRVPAMVVHHAIETARRTDHGADGIALARIATLAFDLPPLIGGEFESWSEVLDQETSALVDWNIAGHTTGAYISHGATKVTWPTRYRLPVVRLRKGENHTVVTFHDGQSLARLVAPSTVERRAFHGHRGYRRPASAGRTRDVTTRAARAARSRQYEAVTLPADVDPLVLLEVLADGLERGAAVKFTTADRTIVGTVRRAPAGKLHAVVGPIKVPGVRTVGALLAAIAPAFT